MSFCLVKLWVMFIYFHKPWYEFLWYSKHITVTFLVIKMFVSEPNTIFYVIVVICLKYCQKGVKPKINQIKMFVVYKDTLTSEDFFEWHVIWLYDAFDGLPCFYRDGYTRVGVYCASNYCCDQLKAEGEVDVFNAVRIIKKNRPALVPNVVSFLHSWL
jgi:hypothetical protein